MRLVLLAFLLQTRGAEAADASEPQCSQAAREWIKLQASSDVSIDAQALLRRLRVVLSEVDLDVCLDGIGAPTAIIELAGVAGTRRVRVAIHDAVTAKKLEREVDLSEIPADGHPLTLVVVADELLRASWAELSLVTAPAPSRAVPAGVKKSMDRALGIAGPRSLGAAAVFEWYAGGQRHSGVDLRGALRLNEPFLLTARLGARWATPVETPLGRVLGTAQVLGVGAAWSVSSQTRRAGLEVHLRMDALRLQLSGEAAHNAIESGSTRFSARATAGPLGFLELNRALRLELEGALGYVVFPIRAYSGASLAEGRVATAMSGLALAGNLALSASF